MGNIEISNPKINDNTNRRFSYSEYHRDNLKEHLGDWRITPASHPKAIDICTGDGAMASHLIQLGWKPENIVCVDQYVSPNPLVAGVKWLYVDVEQLISALRFRSQKIPRNVSAFRGKFDLAVISSPEIDSSYLEDIVCRYFVRRGGHISKW